MRRILTLAGFAAGLLLAAPSFAADSPAPVKLVIKPLLCVIDKDATSCAVTFDIRWKSPQPAEYCLSDSVQTTPLRCWPRALAGEMKQERQVTEEFRYWLSLPAGGLPPPAGAERLSEVKIEVLRVGSDDRRRERRTRHVWDVL
ncbi:MAG TPA: DUF3019 domain-containing protein [Steroidobacteraceae bacterium]|nr:DUF3019 domain-containing protein [Steroidobacteraceae bacterium]